MFLKELPRIHSHGQLDFPEVWLPLAVLSSHIPGGFLARLCVFLRYQLTFPGWGLLSPHLGPEMGSLSVNTAHMCGGVGRSWLLVKREKFQSDSDNPNLHLLQARALGPQPNLRLMPSSRGATVRYLWHLFSEWTADPCSRSPGDSGE